MWTGFECVNNVTGRSRPSSPLSLPRSACARPKRSQQQCSAPAPKRRPVFAIPNFFFVGAGTHPGGGIPGVLSSARIVDRMISADLVAADRRSEAEREAEPWYANAALAEHRDPGQIDAQLLPEEAQTVGDGAFHFVVDREEPVL